MVDNIPPILPPAMSQEELLHRADLVGDATIMAIRWAADKTTPHVASLRFKHIKKGVPRYRNQLLARLRLDRTVEVKMRRIKRDDRGKPLAGQWSDGYRIGDHVMTHLVWDEKLGGYVTLWWNAVWQTPA